MSGRSIKILSFSERGLELAKRIAEALGAEDAEASRCGSEKGSLDRWTREQFAAADALVFVGSAGIAVRAIAPYIVHKTEDPAVVVVDEGGSFAIPILSGHLGGANDLAREIADKLNTSGGEHSLTPVITTATDVNGAFSVDAWARIQDFAVLNPWKIKDVAKKILENGRMILEADRDIKGELPKDVRILRNFDPERTDVYLMDPYHREITEYMDRMLILMPRELVLGVGCRKGASLEQIEEAFTEFLQDERVSARGIRALASIDIKKDEPGLLAFAEKHGFEARFYSAEELKEVEGAVSHSRFVEKTVGVDNVCERSALCYCSDDNKPRPVRFVNLIAPKFAHNGVTLALAVTEFEYDWKWKYE